jgi:hypothetical protein
LQLRFGGAKGVAGVADPVFALVVGLEVVLQLGEIVIEQHVVAVPQHAAERRGVDVRERIAVGPHAVAPDERQLARLGHRRRYEGGGDSRLALRFDLGGRRGKMGFDASAEETAGPAVGLHPEDDGHRDEGHPGGHHQGLVLGHRHS